MDPLTITALTFTLANTTLGGTPVTGLVTYNSTTAMFAPTVNLLPNTTYTATITKGAKDLAGNALVSDYTWSFTTGALPDIISPAVIATDPLKDAINVALNKKITATFSKAMDPATITPSSFSVANTTLGGISVSGTVAYTGTTAVFSPAGIFAPNTTYTVTVTTAAKDLAGNPLLANYVWSFSTGMLPAIVPPVVTSTDPADLATGVAFTKHISAVFSEAMDPMSISTATFTLVNTTLGGTKIAGTVSYSGTIAAFTPTANLSPSTTYTATITTGAKDLSGNALAANYVWSFTTGAAAVIVPPIVTSTDPTSDATAVVLSKKVSATFSDAMDPLTITAASFTLVNTTLGGVKVTGLVSYNGTTATFSPSVNLLPTTTYTATISSAVKNTAGTAMASNYTWSFTTGIAPDIIPPTVIATDPLNNAINVALNKEVSAVFSEPLNPQSVNTTTFLLKQGANAVAGTVSYSGTTAIFSPSVNLIGNTVYTATITTGVKDLAGNVMVSNYVWSFTTVKAPVPPTVVSTDPVNNATNVLLNKQILANFSVAMDPLTINSVTYTVKQGANAVLGVISYSGTTATFVPAQNLTANTVYTATITTGAKNTVGTGLASDYVWNFTTQQPITPPILGTAALFGSFGGSAGITNQGLNTVINNGSIGTTGASTLITGFHDGTTGDIYTETPLNVGDVTGRIYTAPPAPGNAASFAIATQGLLDANIAYNSISPASKPGGSDPGAGELGGLTLAPGVYKAAGGSFKITNGDLTLDAKGDPNAVWIFQTATSLTVGVAGPAGARNVMLVNGAQANNVFWYVGSAATINGAGGGTMTGNILSSAGISFSTAGNAVQTVLNGRAISLNASVTMVNTTINVPQ